jgi:hypothetical protein
MSQIKIDRLTPEQEALIPVYKKKWEKIAFSTERIDRDKASDTIKAVYQLIGKKNPKIFFYNSPCEYILEFWILSESLDINFKAKSRTINNAFNCNAILKSEKILSIYEQFFKNTIQTIDRLNSLLYEQLHTIIYSQFTDRDNKHLQQFIDNYI